MGSNTSPICHLQHFISQTQEPTHVPSLKKGIIMHYMSRNMIFPTMCYVRPAKSQIGLRICAV